MRELRQRAPRGIVYSLLPRDGNWQRRSTFSLPTGDVPIDVKAVAIGDKTKLFVSFASPENRFGRIDEYSPEGVLGRSWTFRDLIAGLAIDEDSRILYVASWDTADIYAIELSGDAKMKSVGSVPGSLSSRPMVFHAKRNRLYVAGGDRGKIFELDPKTHQQREFAQVANSPEAFLISYDRDLIYYSDSSKGKIYSLPLSEKSSRSRPILIEGLNIPSGFARLDNDHILISDGVPERIRVVSEAEPGKIQYSYPSVTSAKR